MCIANTISIFPLQIKVIWHGKAGGKSVQCEDLISTLAEMLYFEVSEFPQKMATCQCCLKTKTKSTELLDTQLSFEFKTNI